MQTEYTTIKISQATKERLLDRGTMRDTYEAVLTKILDELEELEEQGHKSSAKSHPEDEPPHQLQHER